MANSTAASGAEVGPIGALIPSVDPIRLNPDLIEQLQLHKVTTIHILRLVDGGSHDPVVHQLIKKGDGLESRFRELGFSVVPHPCLPVHRTGTARTKNPNYVADDSWRLFRSAVDVIKQFRDDIRVIVSGGDKILHGSLDAVAMCTGRTLIDLVGREFEPLVHPRSCMVKGIPTYKPPNGPFFSETETRTLVALLRHHRTLNSGIPSSAAIDNGEHGWLETNHIEAGIHSKGLASAIERLCTAEDEHDPLIRVRELTSSAKKAIQLTPRGVVQAMMCLNRAAVPHDEPTNHGSLILDPVHITGLMVPPEVVEASVQDSRARKRVREKLERQGTTASGRVIVATMRGVPDIEGWAVEWSGCHADFSSAQDKLEKSVELLRKKVSELIQEVLDQPEVILVINPPEQDQDYRFMNVLRHRLMDAVQKSQERSEGQLGRLNPEGAVSVPVCTDLSGMDSSIASIVSTASIALGWALSVTKLARTGSGPSQTHVPRMSDRIFKLPNREVLHWLCVPRNESNEPYWRHQKQVLLFLWRIQSTSEAIQLPLKELKNQLELGTRPDRLFNDKNNPEKGLCPHGLIEECETNVYRLTSKGQHVAAMLDIMERD